MDYFQYAPVIYRFIAKDGQKVRGPDEIARKSGLSRSTVQRISARSWDNVRYGACKAFVHGCVGGVTDKAIQQRIRDLEKKGIKGLRGLYPNVKKPLFRRGAAGNTRKFLIKVISNQ